MSLAEYRQRLGWGGARGQQGEARPHSSTAVPPALQDKDFGKQALRKEHVNPPAEVSTSLKTYQHFTLEKAYLREDFFWAFTPAAGDFIRFRFFQPLRLERLVMVPTGPRAEGQGSCPGPSLATHFSDPLQIPSPYLPHLSFLV